MARDGHYNSDLPVFYKIIMSYLDKWWEWCSYLVRDVLDTNAQSVHCPGVCVVDALNILLIAICHLPQSLDICYLHCLS